MSGRGDGGATPSRSGNINSGSSSLRNATRSTLTCPYQNTEYFGNKCSRYYDCPAHTTKRGIAGTRRDITNDEYPSDEMDDDMSDGPGAGSTAHYFDTAPSPTASRIVPPSRTASLSYPPSEAGPSGVAAQTEQTHETGITLARDMLESLRGENETPSGPVSHSIPAPMPPPMLPPPRVTSQSEITSVLRHPQTQASASNLNPIAAEFRSHQEPMPSPDFSLPRWQPDSEVTYCPICHSQFSFFVRKHHCRKCGRVVCNSCSPHRITIPHQYIVRAPGEWSYQRYSFLGDEGGIADFGALGGGEQVRLCNPCVPDPNITPPHTQHSNPHAHRQTHTRSQSSNSGNYYNDGNPSRYSSYTATPNAVHDAYTRNRSLTTGPTPSVGLNNPYHQPTQNRIMSGTPPSYYSSELHGTYRPSGYSNPPAHLPRAYLGGFGVRENTNPYASSTSSSSSANRPLPPPPPIPEEDECPICHRELPSRTLPNFESLRESHISSCITSHSTYGPGSNDSGRSEHRTSTLPLRTGMFPYAATEKDCVDSAECTICLEEFVVGIPMARLECLCRFHRFCIKQWFANHPGRCPVHHALQY